MCAEQSPNNVLNTVRYAHSGAPQLRCSAPLIAALCAERVPQRVLRVANETIHIASAFYGVQFNTLH